MIIVAGDSWGRGEWDKESTETHNGLEQYLVDDGYKVLNISIPDANNLQVLYALEKTLAELHLVDKLKHVTQIFLFQTSWTRDFRKIIDPNIGSFVKKSHTSWWEVSHFNSEFVGIWLSRWQNRLSEIAQKYSVKIGIIGGAADTMWFEKFEQEYPGLFIACQSFTNLIVKGHDKIDNPVFSSDPVPKFFDILKNSIQTSKDMEHLLGVIEQTESRISTFKYHPQLWPDGCHPDRSCHFKLYNFLTHNYDIQSH